MPFLPTRCSSVWASCASSSSSRRRASRIRFALNAPHSPRFEVMSSNAARRTPAPRADLPGCRNKGKRSASSGEYSCPMTSASACAYGRAPTTRSCARLSFDVDTSSIVLVIFFVFCTERMRRFSSRGFVSGRLPLRANLLDDVRMLRRHESQQSLLPFLDRGNRDVVDQAVRDREDHEDLLLHRHRLVLRLQHPNIVEEIRTKRALSD